MLATFVDHEITDLEVEVPAGETYSLRLAAFDAFPAVKIHVKVQNGGTFDGAFADFSTGEGAFKLMVELAGEEASALWHYAGYSEEVSQKTVDASALHQARNTRALISQYGIAKDTARLAFIGTSHIYSGMKRCVTAQKEKIIVFDKGAVGKCSPILRIDENDVEASHSAIVGKLSDEHLFYMLSRGIDRESAKRLLTLGYLKPILDFFEGDLQARIRATIEGEF